MSLLGWLSEPVVGEGARRIAAARKELARLHALQDAAARREAAAYGRARAMERADACQRLRAGGGCLGQPTTGRPRQRTAPEPAARSGTAVPDTVPSAWVEMEQGSGGVYRARGA